MAQLISIIYMQLLCYLSAIFTKLMVSKKKISFFLICIIKLVDFTKNNLILLYVGTIFSPTGNKLKKNIIYKNIQSIKTSIISFIDISDSLSKQL